MHAEWRIVSSCFIAGCGKSSVIMSKNERALEKRVAAEANFEGGAGGILCATITVVNLGSGTPGKAAACGGSESPVCIPQPVRSSRWTGDGQ